MVIICFMSVYVLINEYIIIIIISYDFGLALVQL